MSRDSQSFNSSAFTNFSTPAHALPTSASVRGAGGGVAPPPHDQRNSDQLQQWALSPPPVYNSSPIDYNFGVNATSPGPNGGWAGLGWSPATSQTPTEQRQQQQVESSTTATAYDHSTLHSTHKRTHDLVQPSLTPFAGVACSTCGAEFGAWENLAKHEQVSHHHAQSSMAPPPHKRRSQSSPSQPRAVATRPSQAPPKSPSQSTNASLVDSYKYLVENGDHSKHYNRYNPAGWPASLPTGTGVDSYRHVEGGGIKAVEDGWMVNQKKSEEEQEFS